MEVAVELQQALYVTAIGMGLVFMALLVVMGVAMGAEQLFRNRSPEEETPQQHADESAAGEDLRIAAVIAAALTVLDHEAQVEALASLPESVLTLERVPSGWKAAGRLAGMR